MCACNTVISDIRVNLTNGLSIYDCCHAKML